MCKCVAIRYHNTVALCLSSLILGKLIARDGDNDMREKKQINIEIGGQIKTARECAKLTQEQFAEKIDVSPQYVSDLERGVVGISLAKLKRSCTVLGVSSDQILFGDTNKDRSVTIYEKCKNMSDEHFEILVEIISKYSEAIDHK